MSITIELVKEADLLCNQLKSKLWQAAVRKNPEYDRIEKVYLKSTNRYERRYNKWVGLQ